MIKEQKHASELMPKSEEAVQILQARAKQLAKQEINKAQLHGVAFVRFRLSQNESYGIPYQYVQEILHHTVVEKPPCVPNFITGVINWRGALITVIDLLQFFHAKPSKHHLQQQKEFIIIINVDNITLGVLTYQIEGSDFYQSNQLAVPLSSGNIANPEYILGLDHAVTAILHVEALVSSLCQEIKKSLYRIGEVHGNYYQ